MRVDEITGREEVFTSGTSNRVHLYGDCEKIRGESHPKAISVLWPDTRVCTHCLRRFERLNGHRNP